LAILLDKGLLESNDTDTTFTTIKKGLQFIDAYNALNELCDLSGLAIENRSKTN
jgi:predicted transcriptional regulator